MPPSESLELLVVLAVVILVMGICVRVGLTPLGSIVIATILTAEVAMVTPVVTMMIVMISAMPVAALIAQISFPPQHLCHCDSLREAPRLGGYGAAFDDPMASWQASRVLSAS